MTSAKKVVTENIPKFVYYANYGNLDSEIYLPQVIENMGRDDLTGVAEAKARTVKVLFEFVGLNPQEILEMGEEARPQMDGYGRPIGSVSDEGVQKAADRKNERQALLYSAQSRLSRKFRDWWKQGEYSFDFQADGNHFKIWVSDKLRPEPIELENRSTGLQWFLSFFLVFLVESKDTYSNTILLLDEAGYSLHPLAQRDLAEFFDGLSDSHQIIHTTQSPFLVDTDHVDGVKVVYIDSNGYTVASDNLRANEGTDSRQRSVYAVHAALGLSISDTFLQGCLNVIVEGVSDQYYLNGIKNRLISEKAISPRQEIIFVPSGGTKGIKTLARLLSSKDGIPPYIIVDSDKAGRSLKSNIEADFYSSHKDRVITVQDITKMIDSEVENLIPNAV